MSLQSVWQGTVSFFGEKPIVVERRSTQLSSDAGLLVFREFDDRIRWTEQFAAALGDPRTDAEHSLLDMVRMRVYGILADYEDQNDHSTLRKDPVFKLIAGRAPDAPDLASQSTLSRFENAVDVASLNRLRDVFLDAFIASFDAPPARLTLDIDPFDDPTHGRQQLTFFHGYYGQHQYQPRVITCAENDLVVMACL
ncbi:MAG TPA: transposase, partial [Planctomycetaceae bacterium]|nr:transposase [Planctomycetaceae bacterium]